MESKTQLECLPNEIIIEIFEYLSTNDIIYTFFNINERLRNLLLNNKQFLNYLVLPTTNLNTWKNILSIIQSYIQILNIKTIDLSFPFSIFSNLKSIIISSSFGYPDEQIKLIFEINQFNTLNSLKIKENQLFSYQLYNNHLTNQNYILQKIFNHENSLKIFQYSSIIPSFELMNINNYRINIHLNSLTLILNDFGDIFSLISYTPNIKYLNIRSKFPYRNKNLINKIEIKLKKLYLKFDQNIKQSNLTFNQQLNFNQFINDIQQFSSSLICLSINLVNIKIKTKDEFPFNSIKLQQLLQTMTELKQFHLYAKLDENSYNNDMILSNFNDHKWSFGMHKNYFYTLPFKFDYLYEFFNDFNEIKSNNYQILNTNHQIWFYVKSIELCSLQRYNRNFLKNLKIKMPNLTLIKFSSVYSNNINKNNEREKIHVNLNNITTIECTKESIIDDDKWLFYSLPNLKHLMLNNAKLPSIENSFVSILNEKIQQLNINIDSELKQLTDITYVYFSNVQHIFFYLYYSLEISQWHANIIMKILKNFKNLKTLTIYIPEIIPCNDSSKTNLNKLIEYLDINEIRINYQMKYFREYSFFFKI